MKTSTFLFAACAALLLAGPLSAHEFTSRPDGHAPIGVMADHTHKAGEYMASYRYMLMSMDGNRDGTSSLSDADVLADYMVAPLDMRMDMHMVGLMYAPSDKLTLMTMVPYINLEMDHLTRNGTKFTTEGSGLGDIKVQGLFDLAGDTHSGFHLNAGISLPTGDIDVEDDTPAGRSRLPYPMQFGSGTYDLLGGLTYVRYEEWGSFGAQGSLTARLGENDNDYTLGNKYGVSAWAAKMLGSSLSASLRLRAIRTEDIAGADPSLNPNMVPTADPELRGGDLIDLGLGLNYLLGGGHRIAIEYMLPLEQDLDGPQLETDWSLTGGWQYAF